MFIYRWSLWAPASEAGRSAPLWAAVALSAIESAGAVGQAVYSLTLWSRCVTRRAHTSNTRTLQQTLADPDTRTSQSHAYIYIYGADCRVWVICCSAAHRCRL